MVYILIGTCLPNTTKETCLNVCLHIFLDSVCYGEYKCYVFGVVCCMAVVNTMSSLRKARQAHMS